MSRPQRPRVVFRIAAGPRIGFGHLMRARALARALGVSPVVSLRGGVAARAAVRRTGCALVSPGVDPMTGVQLVVVDDPSPAMAEAWVRRARRRGVLVVGIQDTGAATSGANLIVNGGVCGRQTDHARRMSGPRFCLLHGVRPTRSLRGPAVRDQVLIALGGGLHVRRLARRLESAITERCPSARIVVAAGFSASPPPALRSGRWIVSARGLVAPLRSSAVAVVAGGQTLYEACSIGVPTVGLAVVRAQRPAIEACALRGAVVDAGGPEVDDATAARVADAVARLLGERALRRRLAKTARRLVDGRGARRVARRITALVRASHGRGRV